MDTKKKNILIFIPEFPALSETFIEREVSKLVEIGIANYTILCLKKGRGEVSENLRPFIKIRRLNILNLFQHINSLVLILTKFPRILEVFALLSELGFFSRLSTTIKSIGYASIIAQSKPDLIYVHFLSYPSTLIMCVSKILNVKYAISAHAKDVFVESELVERKAQTAEFICICNKNACEHVLKLIPLDLHHKIVLQYHGLDFKFFENFNVVSPAQTETTPVILNVGRLVEKKGQKLLIDACEILKSQNIYFKLYIIGSGPLYFELTDKIKQKGLEKEIEIIGHPDGIPFSKVVEFYRKADVFVFPSIEDLKGDVDGVANVLMEAAAFRIPIVATLSGSSSELISDGVTGYVVSQNDSASLASGIKRALSDLSNTSTTSTARIDEITGNAYAKALASFDININAQKLSELLCSKI